MTAAACGARRPGQGARPVAIARQQQDDAGERRIAEQAAEPELLLHERGVVVLERGANGVVVRVPGLEDDPAGTLPAPRATGEADQAQRCVNMARDIQRAINGLTEKLAAIAVAPLEVRIGIGSGMATVGTFGAEHRADYTAVGVPVNRAARLEPLAPPGGILVDAPTRDLLDGVVTLEAFGEVTLKGFGSPQPAFRVVS